MKTPIDIIIKAKKEMNQNDFCDWLEETLSGGLNRITGEPPITSEEYFNNNYKE
jgi:hypothetical protein